MEINKNTHFIDMWFIVMAKTMEDTRYSLSANIPRFMSNMKLLVTDSIHARLWTSWDPVYFNFDTPIRNREYINPSLYRLANQNVPCEDLSKFASHKKRYLIDMALSEMDKEFFEDRNRRQYGIQRRQKRDKDKDAKAMIYYKNFIEREY